MANYINLGNTCADFNEPTPAAKPYGTNVFYILNSGNTQPLKFSQPMTRNVDGAKSSNLIVYADYQFLVWFDDVVVRSDANRSNWRVITKGTQTNSDLIGPTYSSAQASNVISPVSPPWPATWSAFTSPLQINYSADTSASFGTTNALNLVPSNNSVVTTASSNAFINVIGSPDGGSYTASGFVNPQTFWLRDGSSNRYLRYSGGAFSVIDFDTNPAADPTDISLRFTTYINTSQTDRLFVSLSPFVGSGGLSSPTNIGAVRYEQVSSTWTWFFPNSSVNYSFTTTQPTTAATTAGLPSSVTLLKFSGSSGGYLYWNGTQGLVSGSNFALKDYWNSGLSTSNIITGMQLLFGDITPSQNAVKDVVGTIDYYKWFTLTSPQNLSVSWGNISNVVSIPGGQTYVSNNPVVNGYTPSATREGWVLQAATSSITATTQYALVYANVYNGAFTPVAYANVAPPGNIDSQITFVPRPTTQFDWTTTTIPSHAYCWRCFKCTGTGICPVSAPA